MNLLRAKEAAVLIAMRRVLLALCLLLLTISGSFAAASKPSPKQIAQWIEQLGDNDFSVRENASKQLWQAGGAAESALEKAAKSDDPEVARRARDLLDKYRWGIYPDTPANIVALIRAYQSSEGKSRMEILQKLLESGESGLSAAKKIAAVDVQHRSAIGGLIANKLPAAFRLAATEGQYDSCERWLELGHESKLVGHNQYTAYYLLRGKLPERIAHTSARLDENPANGWLAATLVYLHRANGDLDQAYKAVLKYNPPDLLEPILYERGDWKALAARPDFAGATDPAEKWAYRVAFARLAGKPKDLENAVRELKKCAQDGKRREQHAFVAAKALLLNDRPVEGLELLRTLPEHREMLFELLCARFEFTQALDLAEKEPSTGTEISRLRLARARLLCLLGEKEGEALFDSYSERIKDEINPTWVASLLEEEIHAGLKNKAFMHVAKALNVALPKDWSRFSGERREHLYFAKLFPQQATTAEVLFIVLQQKYRDEPLSRVLKRLRELLEGKSKAIEVQGWIHQAMTFKQAVGRWNNSWPPPSVWLPALAEGATRAGLNDLAASLLKKTASRDALLRLGDLLAAKKQWAEAAETYRRAWEKEQQQENQRAAPMDLDSLIERKSQGPLALFLAGDALVRAGQEKEGKELIEQAHWLPFADAATRRHFSLALTERGHKEAARREFELLARIGEPTSQITKDAARLRALDALSRKDYLHAADGFERSILCCLYAHTNFVVSNNYSTAPARAYGLRARALLAAGKLDEALEQTKLVLLNAPGILDLPIALVRRLERHGEHKEATDLFNRCSKTYEDVCRVYPRYAQSHNQVAWLSACCRRNLDAALEHARKAVELNPTYEGYHDTLAEVYFQRGDKDKAIAEEKRAIELNPQRAFFHKQLKRMQAGDPSADQPSENDEE